jgi:hypothetical protein
MTQGSIKGMATMQEPSSQGTMDTAEGRAEILRWAEEYMAVADAEKPGLIGVGKSLKLGATP